MSYSDQIKAFRTEVQTLQNQAKSLYSDLESRVKKLDTLGGESKAQAERDIQADQAKFDTLLNDAKTKRAELDRLMALEDNDQFLNRPAADPKARAIRGGRPEHKTWGQLVLESQEYKASDKVSSTPRMDRVNVKATYGATDGGGGALVQAQRVENVDIPQRPQSILDLITTVETASDAVEFARMASRTNNAAPVPEYGAGNFGLKPESEWTWELVTVNVKTIATWVAASRRILADVPGLRTIIDVDLTTMVRVALETQIISGNGAGENLTGILNTSGILARTQGSGARSLAGDTVADTIRRAITDVMLNFYEPNAIVLNPTDAETVELTKDTTNQYVSTFDDASGRLWRVPVVQTAAVPAKTAIVGDLAMGTRLWDRAQTEIRVGEPNDFFLRNAVAVLAELRAAFAVVRPSAIEKVTLT